MTEDEKTLAATGYSTALKVARRFARKRPQHQSEFESAAMLGLTRAAQTFDASRSKWSTWVQRAVWHEILTSIKQVNADDILFADAITNTNEEGECLMEMIVCPDVPEDFFDEAIAGHPSVTRKILSLLYRDSKSVVEVAALLGVTRKWVRQLRDAAKPSLREFVS